MLSMMLTLTYLRLHIVSSMMLKRPFYVYTLYRRFDDVKVDLVMFTYCILNDIRVGLSMFAFFIVNDVKAGLIMFSYCIVNVVKEDVFWCISCCQ